MTKGGPAWFRNASPPKERRLTRSTASALSPAKTKNDAKTYGDEMEWEGFPDHELPEVIGNTFTLPIRKRRLLAMYNVTVHANVESFR